MSKDTNAIPIFIISHNRLECLRQLIDWLEVKGYTNVIILDNASTYPPLLKYLESLPYSVHRYTQNHGHNVLFEREEFADTIQTRHFVLTDPDVLPLTECPSDAIDLFHIILEENPRINKVGFSLKIDDIPLTYPLRNTVCQWEERFWRNEKLFRNIAIYKAPIDTTFALYRPIKSRINPDSTSCIRTGHPYTARHLPWYADPDNLSEEDIYYIQNADERVTNWGLTQSESKLRQRLGLNRCSIAKNLRHLIRGIIHGNNADN